MTLHIGFTDTRMGMTPAQLDGVRREVQQRDVRRYIFAHHGMCVGADAQFHAIVEPYRHDFYPELEIVGHPGPPSGWSAEIEVDVLRPVAPYMVRNQTIVDECCGSADPDHDHGVMIAAPLEIEPQPRGGTWRTIAMARREFAAGRLNELVIVGRDGELLDHTRWP